jgi:hypothetical protein
MALLVRIRNMDVYYFPAKILKENIT